MIQAKVKYGVLLAHPTGNANVRHAALALHEAGLLAGLHTTISWRPGTAFDRLLPGGLRAELARRSFPAISPALIHTHPFREMVRLLSIRMGWQTPIRHETGRFSIDAICAALDLQVAEQVRRGPALAGVYAYDDCALHSFQAAKQRGIACLYDLPIGHYRAYRQIAEDEQEARPEWAATLSGIHDSPEKLARKDREIELADAIQVASSFTAKTLKSYPGPLTGRIDIVPYGAPPVGPPREIGRREDPLRILFVGSIGQRKGIGYLLDAVESLEVAYTLTLLGRPVARPLVLAKALELHHWIDSAPHAEVLREMREHDVLVFPSLFEGFGLVILEAMAQGTVVIATPHTAAPDLIEDGRDGFIVPIRSSEAIAARLTQLAENRDLLGAMSEAARQTAASRTWEEYRRRVVAAVAKTLAL